MNKKVLLLGNHGFVIYNFRKELIQELLREGYEVYISLPKDEKVDKMIEWGCKFVETNVDRRGTNPITDFKLVAHYIKILKEIKPDVVLTYTIKPNLYGGLACRLLNIPCINNITGLGSGFSKSALLKTFLSTLYKVSLKKSYCVFFQNTEDMRMLVDRNIIKGHYELIPGSGVNLEEYKFKDFPEEDVLRFIFIGRIMKDKGIDQYLEAAKIIKTKYPDTQFNVIGFVEKTQPHYNDMINQLQNEGFITYLGYQSDVKPFVKEAHCLIQASHGGEGLSNVLLEAAATGRALIASNIPGCRETISENQNGYTFEAKNTSSLVKQIEKFICLTDVERKQMGINSREKIEKEFDRNIVIKAYMNKIDQICNK
ncbi:TPA: glycosyltransferase family 4 protein [Bacillus cereus]|uniref:glycosyltransferase family 4 protein n=1 Tax=Bacillus cereus TaxID=1396 RepID=UPI001F445378|nr:glycosyltransferase family 4 protein [Bacillus cereus]BCC14778.1 capsular polysaccharide biosynthesis protein [Bacillus cereus]HDR6302651.1 glycosyltransferase family 4 protein [Bacillus cereus]